MQDGVGAFAQCECVLVVYADMMETHCAPRHTMIEADVISQVPHIAYRVFLRYPFKPFILSIATTARIIKHNRWIPNNTC